MEKFKIRIHSEDHCKTVLDLLFKLGYVWNAGGSADYRYLDAHSLYADASRRLTYSSGYSWAVERCPIKTLDDLYKETAFEITEYHLNENYKAVFKEKEVQVGCQTFPNKVIDEFVAAYTAAHLNTK